MSVCMGGWRWGLQCTVVDSRLAEDDIILRLRPQEISSQRESWPSEERRLFQPRSTQMNAFICACTQCTSIWACCYVQEGFFQNSSYRPRLALTMEYSARSPLTRTHAHTHTHTHTQVVYSVTLLSGRYSLTHLVQ